MARKDTLAAGARSAKFAGGVGDIDVTRNLSTEPRNEFVPDATVAPVAKKRFRPLGDVVLIRRQEAAPLTTNLVILEDSKEKEIPAQGVILEAGPDAVTVSVGQLVAFGKYAGTTFKLNGETLLLMHVRDILGEILDEPKGALNSLTGGHINVSGTFIGRA